MACTMCEQAIETTTYDPDIVYGKIKVDNAAGGPWEKIKQVHGLFCLWLWL